MPICGVSDLMGVYHENLHTAVHFFLLHIAGGFWAVILSWAVWKRSWAGHDAFLFCKFCLYLYLP